VIVHFERGRVELVTQSEVPVSRLVMRQESSANPESSRFAWPNVPTSTFRLTASGTPEREIGLVRFARRSCRFAAYCR